MYFGASTGTSSPALWRTDGTKAGTRTVRTPGPGVTGEDPAAMVSLGKKMFFVNTGGLLWETDGTHKGTKIIVATKMTTFSFAAANGRLWFAAWDGSGSEPWSRQAPSCSSPTGP